MWLVRIAYVKVKSPVEVVGPKLSKVSFVPNDRVARPDLVQPSEQGQNGVNDQRPLVANVNQKLLERSSLSTTPEAVSYSILRLGATCWASEVEG